MKNITLNAAQVTALRKFFAAEHAAESVARNEIPYVGDLASAIRDLGCLDMHALQEMVAALEQAIRARADGPFVHADLEPATKAILEELVKQKYIPNADEAFIEYQGVFEFRVVPVFCKDICLNVNADGSVTQF